MKLINQSKQLDTNDIGDIKNIEIDIKNRNW